MHSQELAGTIKLSAFSSFSLFECRKVVSTSKSSDSGNAGMLSYYFLIIFLMLEFVLLTTLSICFSICHFAEEYIGLDDNKYIGDLLSEFKAIKDRNKGEILHCKLVFKKKLFRESDEAVTDLMFVQLSYVQVSSFFTSGTFYFHMHFLANTHACSCNTTIC